RGGIFSRRSRRHAGVAAARRTRLRLRSGVLARRVRKDLRRDDGRGKTWLEARPADSVVAPRPRLPEIRASQTGFGAIGPVPIGLEMTMLLDRSPGFGVYIHWPFCAAKCPYCDFNSHVRHQPVDQERFARAFETELA